MSDVRIIPASYKDPAGFVFTYNNATVYRQVNQCYAKQYELLMGSGLYDALINKKYLVPHTETDHLGTGIAGHYKTLLPLQLPFISYPYEWSFSMLKDAALLTLSINAVALQYGMILKDATPYNIQFLNGSPIFIDTLSFEVYNPAIPWIAYRQFCEMFLYPLIVSHYTGEDLHQLLQVYINGISAAFTAAVLPWKSKVNLHIQLHVFLQKGIVKSNPAKANKAIVFNEKKMNHLNNGLQEAVKKLTYKPNLTVWGNYYDATILSNEYLENKKYIVGALLDTIEVATAIDIGSNDGCFSLLAAAKGATVVAIDSDSTCIDRLYNLCKKDGLQKILPLLISFINPSPAIGWAGTERASFLQRAKADVVFALAVIHHLVISNHVPFSAIAALLSQMGKYVIAEFVPREDEKLKMLLNGRKDIFTDYTMQAFEQYFSAYFVIENKKSVNGSSRIIYLLKSISTL